MQERADVPQNYKTKLCDKFHGPTGHCSYGQRCTFVHAIPTTMPIQQQTTPLTSSSTHQTHHHVLTSSAPVTSNSSTTTQAAIFPKRPPRNVTSHAEQLNTICEHISVSSHPSDNHPAPFKVSPWKQKYPAISQKKLSSTTLPDFSSQTNYSYPTAATNTFINPHQAQTAALVVTPTKKQV